MSRSWTYLALFYAVVGLSYLSGFVDARITLKGAAVRLSPVSSQQVSYTSFKAELSRNLGVSTENLDFPEVLAVYRRHRKDYLKTKTRMRTQVSNLLSSICAYCMRTGNQACINIYCNQG